MRAMEFLLKTAATNVWPKRTHAKWRKPTPWNKQVAIGRRMNEIKVKAAKARSEGRRMTSADIDGVSTGGTNLRYDQNRWKPRTFNDQVRSGYQGGEPVQRRHPFQEPAQSYKIADRGLGNPSRHIRVWGTNPGNTGGPVRLRDKGDWRNWWSRINKNAGDDTMNDEKKQAIKAILNGERIMKEAAVEDNPDALVEYTRPETLGAGALGGASIGTALVYLLKTNPKLGDYLAGTGAGAIAGAGTAAAIEAPLNKRADFTGRTAKGIAIGGLLGALAGSGGLATAAYKGTKDQEQAAEEDPTLPKPFASASTAATGAGLVGAVGGGLAGATIGAVAPNVAVGLYALMNKMKGGNAATA